MTEEYTPTTALEVRDAYRAGRHMIWGVSVPDAAAEFDRWLAAHDAQVRREGAVEALREAALRAGRDYLGPGRLITPDDLAKMADRIEREGGQG